ncbi:hypothetical protein [Pseudoblastomonas halimionae]|uniref:HNH endonuclease n=1 Tax=Alteriqipengyuania halimionae TaxID=1926630 RepID=A0A6I4U312_9SPHN|nr:hypothetical protein [Alteriqipengyuania halimionae]MXP08881.1 hypothetical protein [Alteriqipengyuania halimionae]
MARKYSKGRGHEERLRDKAEETSPPVPCWLCGRALGKAIVLHHPVPKSRGGRDVVPMHPICQQTLIANFTNAELQRLALDTEAILENPDMRKFVDWVANKDPDFHASTARKKR